MKETRTEPPPGNPLRTTLEESTVRRVMVPRSRLVTVPPDTTLRELVDDYVLARGCRGFPVVERECVLGLISTDDLAAIPREEWTERTVREAMVPLDEAMQVGPDDDLATALERLKRTDRTRLLVMKHDEVQGLVTRGTIFRHIELESLAS